MQMFQRFKVHARMILFKSDWQEPTTLVDMPCSWASGAALVAGESSAKSFLGEPTL